MKEIRYRAGTHPEDILPGNIELESQIDGARFGISGYLHQASFTLTGNGDILVACGGNKIKGEWGGDYGGSWCYLWRSTDGGKSFAGQNTPFAGNALAELMLANPTLVRLDDRLIILARSASKDPTEGDTWQIFSFDNGHTWGSLESRGNDWEWQKIISFDSVQMDSCPPTGDRGFNLWGPCHYTSRPKVLRDGTIIFALAASWAEYTVSTTRGGSYIFASGDRGQSWSYLGMMPRPITGEVICEPAIQELPDGRLIALVRSYNSNYVEPDNSVTRIASRYFYWITSTDGGRRWSEPWPSYIPSERWNGSMPDIAIQGEYLYLLGNFDQFQPDDFPGEAQYWQPGTQRSVLSLYRYSLPEIESLFDPGTARVPRPEASRPLGINPAADYRLTGTYASVQLEALPDGSLAALSDTHTRAWDRNVIRIQKFRPDDFFGQDDHLWLHRGTLPLIRRDQTIELFDSRCTIRPQQFIAGSERWEIEFDLAVCNLICNREYCHPVFTLWNSAELQTGNLSYPKSVFAVIELKIQLPKDGPCEFIVRTATGMATINLPVIFHQKYHFRLTSAEKFRWALTVDQTRYGEFCAVFPGVPATFTPGYGRFPATAGNLCFAGFTARFDGKTDNPAHPFYFATLTPGTHPLDQTAQNYLHRGGIVVHCTPDADGELLSLGDRWQIAAVNGRLAVNGKATAIPAGSGFAIGGAALQNRVYLVGSQASEWLHTGELLPPDGRETVLRLGRSVISAKLIGCDGHPSALRKLIPTIDPVTQR